MLKMLLILLIIILLYSIINDCFVYAGRKTRPEAISPRIAEFVQKRMNYEIKIWPDVTVMNREKMVAKFINNLDTFVIETESGKCMEHELDEKGKEYFKNNLAAFYSTGEQIIFIPEEFQDDMDRDKTLVHELVHHIQNLKGLFQKELNFNLEAEAFYIESRFFDEFYGVYYK